MKTKLFNLWDSLRTSLWFIPSLMVFAAIGVSFLLLYIDKNIVFPADSIGSLLYNAGPEGARSLLSTIAGSVMTVAGVTFSITIVALTLASSQFGPRLLRNFMQDKSNQLVLGTFISTFIYCLLVLRSVEIVNENTFVPSLSVSLAVVLMVVNAGVLVFFIHHISISIQADYVITAVYADLLRHMERIFDYDDEHRQQVKCDPSALDRYVCRYQIAGPKDGYIQAIDYGGLLKMAQTNDYLLRLHTRAGKFIMKGEVLMTVRSTNIFEKKHIEPLFNSLIIGAIRTPEQDPEYNIHQLVEVALRALSPGINDPFTAISCIDRLGSALAFLTTKKFPAPYIYDKEGKIRIIITPIQYSGMVNAAFDQIRQCGRTSEAVTIRLLEVLGNIALHTCRSDQQEAILRQAMMVQRASRANFPEKNDRTDVQERYRNLLAALHDTQQGQRQEQVGCEVMEKDKEG